MGMTVPVGAAGPRVPDREQPPQKGAPAGEFRAFFDKKILYEHPYRVRRASTWRRGDLYLQALQWLRKSYNTDITRTVHWSPLEFDDDDPEAIPTPVYNEVLTILQNETARLGRPEYKPYVRPEGENPDAKVREGAKVAENALHQALEDCGWDGEQEKGLQHLPLYGGWILKSWWDRSMEETVRVPVLTAMRCPHCDARVADPVLSPEIAGTVDEKRLAREDYTDKEGARRTKYTLGVCPTCDSYEEEAEESTPALDDFGQPMQGPDGAVVMVQTKTMRTVPEPPEMEPFTPVGDELQEKDVYDRDLGQDVPLGRWCCETLSPYDLWWENCGIGVKTDRWQEIAEAHVETLDWIRARWPQKAGDIKAENTDALLMWHPIGGERAIYYGSMATASFFKHSCRVKEYHKRPFMEQDPKTLKWRMNRGRSIIMAGNVVLLDGDFLMESRNNPGVLIERVHYDYAPWELRSGGLEADGISLMEQSFDSQDAINECASMTQDARQRMASPKWIATRGMNLTYEHGGSAGAYWMFDPDPDAPAGYPREAGSTTIPPGVTQELDWNLAYLMRVGNTQEVETGSVPPGVTAASAIQIMAEQAGERRRPRIRRIRKMLERVWSHGLKLMHEFVREPRTYWIEEGNDWQQRAWTGLDFLGQTQIRIDPEPEHDTTLQKKENMKSAIDMGVINVQASKKAQMLIARKLEVPSDLYEEDDLQYDAAEREFIDYLEQNKPPVIDPDLDDPDSHYDRHGIDCMSEKWRAIEDQAKWHDALLWLWGWEEFEPYASMIVPQSKAPELQIYGIWQWILVNGGYYQTRPPEEVQALQKVLRFRAHMAAHKRIQEMQQAAAQSGAAVAAAPGAAETQAGTVPTPGQPATAATAPPTMPPQMPPMPMMPGMPQG